MVLFVLDQEQVIRLDVTMDDVLIVQKFKSQARLLYDLNSLLLCKRDTRKCIVKVNTFEMLLHDEKAVLVLEDVVHANDVWMACIH